MRKERTKRFEILEHTADLRLKVFGSSPMELFRNALYAMAYVQKPEVLEQTTVGRLIGHLRGRGVTEDVSIESMDYNTLLVDFLSEVLSHSDAHNAVFFDIKFNEFSELKAEGKIYGVKVDEFKEDIKAVTYHEVDVKEVEPGKWESLLVFDI
ncbi:MAG: archease [Candidatus Paceibacteria bacterium]